MSKIIESYTASKVIAHLSQSFRLRLLTPSERSIAEFKNFLSLTRAGLDSDDDFVGAGGVIPHKDQAMVARLNIYLSRNVVEVSCLGATTHDCFDVLYLAFSRLFDVGQEQVDEGIDYVDYDTVTKVQLDSTIFDIFGSKMQDQIKIWKDLRSETVIKVNDGVSWGENQGGIIDISKKKFDRLYKGQDNAVVVPSVVQFTIVVPTNYGRTSHHNVSIVVESVEDFYENTYFVKSEMPYESHIGLIDLIENASLGEYE